MGLSIHYKGNFKKSASLPGMIIEIEDVAKFYNWTYHIFEKDFPLNALGKEEYKNELYGISFSPPKCEPVWMCFLLNGMLSSPGNLQLFSIFAKDPNNKYLPMISTKTQFAGIEVHKTLMHLLDYLSKKYFDYFNLTDEGGYWENRDEKELEEVFKRYENMMGLFVDGLENIPKRDEESIEDFLKRIYIQFKGKDKSQ